MNSSAWIPVRLRSRKSIRALSRRCANFRTKISRYVGRVDVDPARLAELEERLNLIQSFKRKYGKTIEEINAFGAETKRKLESLESRDAELARINAALEKLDAEIWKAGQSLSAKRKKIIPQLAKNVGSQLGDLGFQQSRFDVQITTLGKEEFSNDAAGVASTGFDSVEFQFSPNAGEPAKALRAIASSGEMARVMLALKTVLAAEDEIPVLVFDEVDANVGGETANAVGEKNETDRRASAGVVHHASAAGRRAGGCALRRDQAGA